LYATAENPSPSPARFPAAALLFPWLAMHTMLAVKIDSRRKSAVIVDLPFIFGYNEITVWNSRGFHKGQ